MRSLRCEGNPSALLGETMFMRNGLFAASLVLSDRPTLTVDFALA